jgi:hypothetical protein
VFDTRLNIACTGYIEAVSTNQLSVNIDRLRQFLARVLFAISD